MYYIHGMKSKKSNVMYMYNTAITVLTVLTNKSLHISNECNIKFLYLKTRLKDTLKIW